MPPRACRECGVPFIGTGQLCDAHRRRSSQARDTRYDDPAYRRLRKRMLGEWVRLNGWTCPGLPELRHQPHPSTDLTLDHILELSRGGSLLDRGNLRVACRSINDVKRHAKRRGVGMGG